MKRGIMGAVLLALSAGCHIPYPAVGVRPPRVVETYTKICTTTVKTHPKTGAVLSKHHKCRWVRLR
jgi:hypothetical protein